MRVVWTENAVEHLEAIYAYHARYSSTYADGCAARLIDRSEQIAAFPLSGRRLELYEAEQVREIIEPPYRIFYHINVDAIEILAVIHSATDLPPT